MILFFKELLLGDNFFTHQSIVDNTTHAELTLIKAIYLFFILFLMLYKYMILIGSTQHG